MWKYSRAPDNQNIPMESDVNGGKKNRGNGFQPQPCKWAIGWNSPFLMMGPFILGLIIAVTHSVVFRYLDGRYEKDPNIPSQSHVTAASTVTATVVGTLLRFSLAAAFTQYFWYLIRKSPMHLETIESLYTLRGNLWGIFSQRVLRKGWLLVTMAAVIWCLPIAMSFPPSAMTVRNGLDIKHAIQDGIPSLDLGSTFGGNRTAFKLNSIVQFVGRKTAVMPFVTIVGNATDYLIRDTILNLAVTTMVEGQARTMESPCGLNCTYTIQFDGPYFSCNKTSQNLTMDFKDGTMPAFSANWVNPARYNDTYKLFNTLDQGHFRMTNRRLNYQETRLYSSDYVSFPVSTTMHYTDEVMSCHPRRAEYEVIQKFENGQQSSTTNIKAVHKLAPLDKPVLFLNGNITNWLDKADTPESRAHIRDGNLIGVMLAMTLPLSGSYSPTVETGAYARNISDGHGGNITRMTPSFAYRGIRNGTVVDLTPMFIGYGSHSLTPIPPDNSGAYIFDLYTQTAQSLFNLDEGLFNSLLQNVTLSTIAQYGLWKTSVNVTRSQLRSQYAFSSPINILLPYFLSLAVVLLLIVVGFWALRKNGVPAIDNGFLQILMTTRGNPELDKLAGSGCLGGNHNVPPALKKYEVMFGELPRRADDQSSLRRRKVTGCEDVGIDGSPVIDDSKSRDNLGRGYSVDTFNDGAADEVRLAGFGSKDEVIPLQKGKPYGVIHH